MSMELKIWEGKIFMFFSNEKVNCVNVVYEFPLKMKLQHCLKHYNYQVSRLSTFIPTTLLQRGIADFFQTQSPHFLKILRTNISCSSFNSDCLKSIIIIHQKEQVPQELTWKSRNLNQRLKNRRRKIPKDYSLLFSQLFP